MGVFKMRKRIAMAALPLVISMVLCNSAEGMILEDVASEDTVLDNIDAVSLNVISNASKDTVFDELQGEALEEAFEENQVPDRSIIDELTSNNPPAVIYGDGNCRVYSSLGDIYEYEVIEGCSSEAIKDRFQNDIIREAMLPVGTTVYLKDVVFIRCSDSVRIVYLISYFDVDSEYIGFVTANSVVFSDENWLRFENDYLVPNKAVNSSDISLITRSSTENRNYQGANKSSSSDDILNANRTDYEDIAKFPASYQAKLTSLKNKHSNWVFVPLKTNLDFNYAVENEMQDDRSYIYKNEENISKGFTGADTTQKNWCYATKSAVSYFMDPRNYFNEKNIFAFEQLTFNASYHSESAVAAFLSGTFMNGKIPGDSRTYANAFYTIGAESKLSPTHLASRVYQEQGSGTSPLISGSYAGYEGYYNYFNVGATGATSREVILNGLKYAKEKGWDTRYKSLEGGAATIGKNYLLKGQDTIYLEKFNVNPDAAKAVFTHQYMQNIQAPMTESNSTYKIYSGAGSVNSPFIFKIPVYGNMSSSVSLSKTSATVKLNDSITLTLKDMGAVVASDKITWSSSNTSVATVKNGVVKAVGLGENNTKGVAIITAKYAGIEYKCTITVINPIESVSLAGEEITMRRKDTVVADTKGFSTAEKEANISEYDLEVTVSPKNTTDDCTITYSSSNKNVATVDKEGHVTAVGIGTATITATASKASGSSKPKASCAVKVIAPVYRVELKDTYVNAKGNTDEEREQGKNVIYKGQKLNLSYEYWPKDTTDDVEMIFKSSKASVAEISKGTVTGKGTGSATLTLTISHYSSSINVKVKKCIVQFMKKDLSGVLKEYEVPYGYSLMECEGEGYLEVPKESDLKLSVNEMFLDFYTESMGGGAKLCESFCFEEELTKLYPYVESTGKEFYVKPVGSFVYTGGAIKPEPYVYETRDNGNVIAKLTKGVDYKVSYSNNVKVSDENKKARITVTGIGNYAGKVQLDFDIVKKSLNSSDITFSNLSLNYNKKIQKASPVLYRNGKKLKKNTDYTVTYPLTDAGAYKNKGTYPIRLEGKGGYCGSIIVYETISEKINLSKVTVKVKNINYDKKQINYKANTFLVPEYSVVYKGKPLVASTDGSNGDYTVEFENNDKVGTAVMIISATDSCDYHGSKRVEFKVLGNKLSQVKVSGIENKEYTGNTEDLKQKLADSNSGDGVILSTKDGAYLNGIDEDEYEKLSNALKVNYDYVVSYKNLNKAGTATVIFTGVNGFSGTVKKNYKITKCNINTVSEKNLSIWYYTECDAVNAGLLVNNSGIGLPIEDLADVELTILKKGDVIYDDYVKGGSRPQMLLNVNGLFLSAKDFAVTYKNNGKIFDPEKNIKATVSLKGKGNYEGTLNFEMLVSKTNMKQGVQKIKTTDVVYSLKQGGILNNPVIVDCNGKTLKKGTDYAKDLEYTYDYVEAVTDKAGNLLYRNNGDKVQNGDVPSAGTVITVAAHGINNYEGIILANYRISKVNLNDKKIKVVVKAKTYNGGSPVTLKPEDLTVTYDGRELCYGVDYLIDSESYVKNCNNGTASVTILAVKSDSNYGGSRVISFKILPKSLVWI